MPTYTKETALYDTGAIRDGINGAAETASKYLTVISGTTGISVHNENDNKNFVNMNANDGVTIYRNINGTATDVANFGETARVGISTEGNLITSANGIVLKDGQRELAAFGADGQSFKNEYSENVVEFGFLPTMTRTAKLNWTEYSGESPFEYVLPWGISRINEVRYYRADRTQITSITVSYVVDDRKIIFDSTACATMTANNVAYISVSYHATGKFPYYTFGSDGIGDIGAYSFREGENTVASGNTSHAEGESTIATGANSHAENYYTVAEGTGSHAEGGETQAIGSYSHAEGRNTQAIGSYSHAEGRNTRAIMWHSHAEGVSTTASGVYSHVEGSSSYAEGQSSHAEGHSTIANGDYSHAQNMYTVATENSQTVIGKYNAATVTGSGTDADPYEYSNVGDYAFIIGNGTDNTTADRSNALTVDWNGNVEAQGTISDGGGQLGERIITDDAAASRATGRYFNVASVTLPKGMWIVTCACSFADGTNATGIRRSYITTDAPSGWNNTTTGPASTAIVFYDQVNPLSGNFNSYTRGMGTASITTDTPVTYYLVAYHTAGSAINVTGRINAIRVGTDV